MAALPILFLILASVCFYFGHKKQGNTRAVLDVSAVLILLLTFFTGMLAAGHGEVVGVPMGDPRQTVVDFFTRLQSGEETALVLLQDGSDLLFSAEDEVQTEIRRAQQEALDYSFRGDCVREGRTAKQDIQLRYLDVDAMLAPLPDVTEQFLSAAVQTRPMGEVITPEETYVPGIPEEAYARALADTLGTTDPFICTQTLTLTLQYDFGGWRIQATPELLRAIRGTAAQQPLTQVLAGSQKTALMALPLFRKQYSLPVEATAGCLPNPAGYGEVSDPRDLLPVLEEAQFLLDGQSLSWNPDIPLMPGSTVRYYRDPSILVIVWKEVHNDSVVTFAEVKLAHASQLRRVLCQDSFGSKRYEKPSRMAHRTNSVLAINGDFYGFRGVGISVYQGQVYRRAQGIMDTCFVDGEGRLLFTKAGELTGAAIDAFVQEHQVNFAVTFGPILLEDGQFRDVSHYGIGEVYEPYPRSALGWVDDLHYIVAALNAEGPYKAMGTVPDMARYMAEKGCVDAYELDGGRSTAMCMNGKLVNRVNLGGEKPMSDMIYFASAVPQEDW